MTVEDGHLRIDIKREEFQQQHITSARVKTIVGWKYGRIDIRARLPGGTGTWPAIWMLPTNPRYGNMGWPDNGEVDIMEHAGQEGDHGRFLGSIYSKSHIWMDGTGLSTYRDLPTAETEFHTYSVLWNEEKMQLLVDGVAYITYVNPHTNWQDWPFDQEYQVILNVAAGGWGGDVDINTLPQTLDVDYVRVYQQQTPAMNELAANTGLFW
jgi:licheninase